MPLTPSRLPARLVVGIALVMAVALPAGEATSKVIAARPGAALTEVEAAHVAIYQRCAPAVVGIACQGVVRPGAPVIEFYGTGAVVSADGLILTSTTVVPQNGRELKVYFTDGRVRSATVVEQAAAVEAIVLRVDATDLPYMRLADSRKYLVADPVYTWGNPYFTIQRDGAVSLGVGALSGIYRVASADDQSRYLGPVLETDAAVNPGSDGGPLTDADGNLVGMISLAFSRTRWLGLAIPTHGLIAALPSLGKMPLAERRSSVPWSPHQALLAASGPAARATVAVVVVAPGTRLADRRADEPLVALPPVPSRDRDDYEAKRPDHYVGSGLLVDADTVVTSALPFTGPGEARGSGKTRREMLIAVYLADGRRVDARLLGTDSYHDLACLRVTMPGDLDRNLVAPVALGDSVGLVQGRAVAALGRSEAPGGLTFNTGMISAVKRNRRTCWQISALINYGNLGGPVIDLSGTVIGLATHLGERTPWRQNCGVGFAIHSEIIKEVLPDLKAGRAVPRPTRAVLGVRGDEGALDIVGARINAVVAGGAAAKAGLKDGDIIVAYGGKPIEDWVSLIRAIRDGKPGDPVTLRLRRGNQEIAATLELGEQEWP